MSAAINTRTYNHDWNEVITAEIIDDIRGSNVLWLLYVACSDPGTPEYQGETDPEEKTYNK